MKRKNITITMCLIVLLMVLVLIIYYNIPKNSNDESNYSYKIESDTLYVTYNNGKVWNKVPIVFNINDDYEFKEGTYQMAKDKTVFVYGEDIIYSNNMGKTWETAKISDSEYGSGVMYVSFFNKDEGITLVANDYAMGSVMANIYTTMDGGATWSKKYTNSDGFIDVNRDSEIKFFNKTLGFISDPANGGNNATLWVTRDGGITFDTINLPEQKLEDERLEWNKVYDCYELPTFENDVLTVIASQGYDADYKGGNMVAEYQSKDMGLTWEYIGEFEIEK